ncbi:MAG: endo-1,4-beta-xylanase [Rhodobacter sp.]|nr:endo-1,4-beta-xylanase [Rhodobacter sp.]
MGGEYSRRAFFAISTAGLAIPYLSKPLRAQTLPSLAKIAARRGLEFGSCFSPDGNAAYNRLVAFHSTVTAAEWGMKPREIAPSARARRWGTADRAYQFATQNGLRFHGHTLFWHQEPLSWAADANWETVKAKYGGFIREVAGRYHGAVSWDVLNEPLEEATRLRNEVFLNRFGIDFIEFCLREAHAVAPNAKLVINDYNLDCAGNWCSSKRRNALWLLKELRKRKAPVHALGIQGHLSSKYSPSGAKTASLIKAAARSGIASYITEMDVNDSQFPADIAKRDERVAEYYYEFLRRVLKAKGLKRVMFWGFGDRYSWITKGHTGERRRPGTGAARPVLFDAELRPKPAFWAIKEVLEA